jgi:hypothetical protein
VDFLEDALRGHGKPEKCNRNQGSQLSSDEITGVFRDAKSSKIKQHHRSTFLGIV